jgi:circadian clock protein KaiC
MKFQAPSRQLSTGIPELDLCLQGKGYYEGSSILLSGSSGSGKTTFAGAFAKSVVEKKLKCLFYSFEESEAEILRNFMSVGMDLRSSVKNDLLKIICTRPTQHGLERHLGNFINEIDEFEPNAVVIDPLNTLNHCGSEIQVYSVLTRMIDYLKKKKITFLMTMSSLGTKDQEFSYGLSSIIDTFIIIRNEETNGELNRDLLIVKSRGMAHSNQVREFSISSKGIKISDPYCGEAGVLTGTARIVQESKDAVLKATAHNELEKLQREIELKKRLAKIQLQGLDAELDFKIQTACNEEKFFKFKEELSNSTRKTLKEHRVPVNKNKPIKANHGKKGKI